MAPSCLSRSSAVKLSLSRSMKRRIVQSAGDSTSPSGKAYSPARPSCTGPEMVTPAARRMRAKAAVVAERGERRRLVDEEARPPAGDGAPRVEPGLVPRDPAGHVADAGRPNLGRERAKAGARKGRIPAALEHEPAAPRRPVEIALAEDVGLEPVRRPQRRESGVRERQLLVRGRCERAAPVLRVDGCPVREVEGDRR